MNAVYTKEWALAETWFKCMLLFSTARKYVLLHAGSSDSDFYFFRDLQRKKNGSMQI